MNKDETGAVSTANALKMAILNLEVCASLMATHEYSDDFYQSVSDAIDTCKEALEQPAQEPLSDDDIFKIVSTIEQIKPQYGMMLSNEWNILDFARAIEQAHGIV
jgi:hypothetical protein